MIGHTRQSSKRKSPETGEDWQNPENTNLKATPDATMAPGCQKALGNGAHGDSEDSGKTACTAGANLLGARKFDSAADLCQILSRNSLHLLTPMLVSTFLEAHVSSVADRRRMCRISSLPFFVRYLSLCRDQVPFRFVVACSLFHVIDRVIDLKEA